MRKAPVMMFRRCILQGRRLSPEVLSVLLGGAPHIFDSIDQDELKERILNSMDGFS